jgi:hypothetical protein
MNSALPPLPFAARVGFWRELERYMADAAAVADLLAQLPSDD